MSQKFIVIEQKENEQEKILYESDNFLDAEEFVMCMSGTCLDNIFIRRIEII